MRGDLYDEKADVYSFGVILWVQFFYLKLSLPFSHQKKKKKKKKEIMTGQRPFSGYRLRQVIAAVCDSKERPSDLVAAPVCAVFGVLYLLFSHVFLQ